MIRYRKNNLVFFFLLICSTIRAQETDIFSEQNTSDFARFLFMSNQYNYAAEEYERLTFLFPENEEYQIGLLKSYRFARQYDKGILTYQSLVSKKLTTGIKVQQEYIKLNLLEGNTLNLTNMLGQLDTESSFRNNLDLTIRLISYPEHSLTLEGIDVNLVDAGLLSLYNESASIKHKSPFLAGTFSTLIPGMGKVYSGRWKDGLIAFLFVGATGFQAYRGFDKKGVKSVYGWIMGSISVGFYIGNIYGSVRTAKIYNSNQSSMYVEKVSHYYIGHL